MHKKWPETTIKIGQSHLGPEPNHEIGSEPNFQNGKNWARTGLTAYIHIYMYIHTYTYTHIHIHIYIYIYIYIEGGALELWANESQTFHV